MPEKAFGPDGTCKVRFKLPAEAKYEGASVVGEFNGWSAGATQFDVQEDGSFAAEVNVEPGKSYRFRYLLGDGRWENDWAADAYVDNEFGGSDSVITVPIATEVRQAEAPAESGDGQAFGVAVEATTATSTKEQP
ncbi:MAG: isoamylase early set domain-containing protein [Acidimicrobiia bacterium]|nr:isoamylase early set domain-containing protein [Acidimicrobiia bacterium]